MTTEHDSRLPAASDRARELIAGASCTTQEAMAIYDALPAMSTESMLGNWRGVELMTSHPYDGLLRDYGWYGKSFVDEETVHPLVFEKTSGARVTLEPRRLFPGLRYPQVMTRHPLTAFLFRRLLWVVSTRRSRARLRGVEHRGVVTAAMVYDHLPVVDVFRRVDQNCVMGWMDEKGQGQPYFFALMRDSGAGV